MQADAPRKARLKAEKAAEKKSKRVTLPAESHSLRAKTCPQCGARVSTEKKTCDCGFAFATR